MNINSLTRLSLWSTLLILIYTPLCAQQTEYWASEDQAYYEGIKLYDQGAYAAAEHTLSLYLKEHRLEQLDEFNPYVVDAEYHIAICGIRRDVVGAEQRLTEFIRAQRPAAIADQAGLELGNYYFNNKQYENALSSYELINIDNLNADHAILLRFKQGYSEFVIKEFQAAVASFETIKDFKHAYYYPSNYYHGLAQYYLENYEEAIRSLKIVERSQAYQNIIPYYIATIYAKQDNWQAVADYLSPRMTQKGIKNFEAINMLIGQAYFKQGQYDKALPYLEFYEQNTSKLRAEDFYQIGYAQYQTGKYDQAVKTFSAIGNDQKSGLSQSAHFYRADSYLKIGDKEKARTAFLLASQMTQDPELSEEALYNYGLLSAELRDDRTAVGALTKLSPSSKYYDPAQEALSDLFLRTSDYSGSLAILEDLDRSTPTLRTSYQRVTYRYGVQELKDGRVQSALSLLQKSYQETINPEIHAETGYYLGYIAHRQKKYALSDRYLTVYFREKKNNRLLAQAQYVKGYNLFVQNKYYSARKAFEEINSTSLTAKQREDVSLRIADGFFADNKYDEALVHYNLVQGYSRDYALLQMAAINGVQKNHAQEALLLNQLLDKHPRSGYKPDALYALAESYIQLNQSDRAIASYSRLLEEYPDKAEYANRSRLKLGLLAYNQGDINSALKYYRALLQSNPTKTQAAEAIAAIEEIYIDDKKDPDGYADFLETFPAFKLGNAAKDSLNYRTAFSMYEDGEYDRATQAFSIYLDKFPGGIQRIDAMFFRAESFTLLKEYPQALNAYKLLIEQGSSHRLEDAIYKAASISYNHSQDFTDSYLLYNRYAELADDPRRVYDAQMGALLSAAKSGNDAGVLKYAQIVIDHEASEESQLAQAHYHRAQVYYKKQTFPLAADNFNTVTRYTDNEQAAESRYRIADIYYRQEQLDLAETFSEQALQLNAAYPYWRAKTLILLADIYRDKSDFLNARAALNAVVEYYKENESLLTMAQTRLAQLDLIEQNKSRVVQQDSSETLEMIDNE